MRSENCTDTIPSDRPLSVQILAIAWFAGRQLLWWTSRALDGVLLWAERARQRRQRRSTITCCVTSG
jgi:hypothetical protein